VAGLRGSRERHPLAINGLSLQAIERHRYVFAKELDGDLDVPVDFGSAVLPGKFHVLFAWAFGLESVPRPEERWTSGLKAILEDRRGSSPVSR